MRVPARAPLESWCQQQHSGLLIRPVRVQLPPAPPGFKTRGRRFGRILCPFRFDLRFNFTTRRARAAKGPACNAEDRGCKSRRRVHFGVVVTIAARRARNAEETERNRPAPPAFAERSDNDGYPPKPRRRRARYAGGSFVLRLASQFSPRGVHRCTAVFQTAGAGALPASGTISSRP